MLNASPLVSVIMNCYNSAQYLREAIYSVYMQTFPDWEIIFWDNCSTDDSPGIARGFDARLHYFRGEKNVPLGHARNLAMERARGKYVAFLDCDDLWLSHKLEVQVALMEADLKAGVVFSDAISFFGRDKEFSLLERIQIDPQKIFSQLLRNYCIPMSTAMIRRDIMGCIGGQFDESFSVVEDADLFIRAAHDHHVLYVNEPLARRRVHAKSWTASRKELFPREEEMMLGKFASLWPSFTGEYKEDIAFRRAIIDYQYAVLAWEKGAAAEARARLAPHLRIFRKWRAAFFFTYFPYSIYRTLKFWYKTVMTPFLGATEQQAF